MVRTAEEFIENLAMPEELLGLRGHFVERKDEPKDERKKRYAQWEVNHNRIDEWTRLYRSLGDDYINYVELIKDNDFSMDNYARASNPILRKMFIHNLSYLSILRNIETLGAEALTYIKVGVRCVVQRTVEIYNLFGAYPVLLPQRYAHASRNGIYYRCHSYFY